MDVAEPALMRRPYAGNRSAGNRSVYWALLLVVCAIVRIGAIGWGWRSLEDDPDAYRVLAATWHDTGTYGRVGDDGIARPTAYRPPLYPWILSWWSRGVEGGHDLLWIATLHCGLGILTCLLTAHLGRLLGLSRRMAVLAALLVAIDPILLRQSMLVMTETLATFLSLLVWWLWLRNQRRAVVATETHEHKLHWQDLLLGALMGLTVLCRPTALAWFVLWFVVLFRKTKWQTLSAWAFGIAMVLVPWGIRNAIVLGSPIVTTTHGGYTLYLANNPILFQHWERSVSREWPEDTFHAAWREERLAVAGQGEVQQDRFANGLALQTIQQNPGGFVWGCGVRLGWFWAMWPSQRQASFEVQSSIGFWYLTIYALSLIGLGQWWRGGLYVAKGSKGTGRGRRAWIPGILLILSLSMVHSVYWSNMRMRAPVVPVLSLLACGALAGWISHHRPKTP